MTAKTPAPAFHFGRGGIFFPSVEKPDYGQNPGSIHVGIKVLSDCSMGATQPNPELSCDQSWDEVKKTDRKIKT